MRQAEFSRGRQLSKSVLIARAKSKSEDQSFTFQITLKPFWSNTGDETKKNLMTINIQPLQDRVIVKRIDEGEQVRGGIIIPDTAKEKPQEGEVIAAGEGKYRDDGSRQALDVKAGDRVLFGKYSGSEVKIEGEELLIIREDEILGIIRRAGAAAGGGGSRKGRK